MVSVFSLTLLQGMGQRQLLPWGEHLRVGTSLTPQSWLLSQGMSGLKGVTGFQGPMGPEVSGFAFSVSPALPKEVQEPGAPHWKDGSKKGGLGLCRSLALLSGSLLQNPWFGFFFSESWI